MQAKDYNEFSSRRPLFTLNREPPTPVPFLGYNISMINGLRRSQCLQVFVLLQCHLTNCTTCKAYLANYMAQDFYGPDSDLRFSTLFLANLFRRDHSQHALPRDLENFQKVFDAIMKAYAPEVAKLDLPSTSVLHEHHQPSGSSSSSCFSVFEAVSTTNPTFSNTTNTPPTSHNTLTQPLQASPTKDSAVPPAEALKKIDPTEKSSKRHKCKKILKQIFHKPEMVKEVSKKESKRSKVKGFFKKSFNNLKGKKTITIAQSYSTELVRRDMRLSLQKYQPRDFRFFLRIWMEQQVINALKSLVGATQNVRVNQVESYATAQEINKAPKAICWYPENTSFAIQTNHISPSLLTITIDAEKNGCNFFFTKKENTFAAIKINGNAEIGSPSLSLSFNTGAIGILSSFGLVVESFKFSFESSILSGTYGFQNYDFDLKSSPVSQISSAYTAPKSLVSNHLVGYLELFRAEQSSSSGYDCGCESREVDHLVGPNDKELAICADQNALTEPLTVDDSSDAPEKESSEERRSQLPDWDEGLEQHRSVIYDIIGASEHFSEVSDRVLIPKGARNIPYLSLPNPFLQIEGSDQLLENIKDFEYTPVTIMDNDSKYQCEVGGEYHILRCLHKTPCYMHLPHSLATHIHNLAAPASPLYKFGQFVNLAYPRLGFSVLELCDFESIEEACQERHELISILQQFSVKWVVIFRAKKLKLRQGLRFVNSLDSRNLSRTLKRIKVYSPDDWRYIKSLPELEWRSAVDTFIEGYRLRMEQNLKKSDAREAMMHQTYMGTMALLLDPCYELPEDFGSKFIAKFCAQIEQSYRCLNLSLWSDLRALTESIETASVTFMWLNGVIDIFHRHNTQYRAFVKELLEIN